MRIYSAEDNANNAQTYEQMTEKIERTIRTHKSKRQFFVEP